MPNVLANIFGASPVMPLERHIEIACKCAKKLIPLFEAASAADWDTLETVASEIDALEHEADELKKEIRLHLPKSLFMPVPRQDLLELLLVQDKIANVTRDIAGIVRVRRLQMPNEVNGDFLRFVERVVDAAKQARKSVRELDELFTSGFRGAEADLVEALIEELDRIETDTDQMQIELHGSLMAIEKKLDPVDAVFLYRIIEMTGEVADMAERAGRRLELLLSH